MKTLCHLKKLPRDLWGIFKPKSGVWKVRLAPDTVMNLRECTILGAIHSLQLGVFKVPSHSLHTVWLPCSKLSQHFEKLSSNVYEESLNNFTLSSRNFPFNKLLLLLLKWNMAKSREVFMGTVVNSRVRKISIHIYVHIHARVHV